MANKLYSLHEIKKNCENDQTWVVINNSVYNVTDFLNEHPGGEEVLLEQSGKNATEAFEDVGHSTDAREMMKKYKIGELLEADRVKTDDKKTNKDWTPDSSEGGNSSWKAWLIPVALGILATIVYRVFILSQ